VSRERKVAVERIAPGPGTATRDSQSTRNTRNSQKTNDRMPFYPRRFAFRISPDAILEVPDAPLRLEPLIGTPERLETRVSHTKQTVAHPSNRYRFRHAGSHRFGGRMRGNSEPTWDR
jgi:hypothetical protein